VGIFNTAGVVNFQAASASALSQEPETNEGDLPIQGPISIEQNLTQAALNEQKSYVEDGFWLRPNLDIKKWDKYCPYELLVVNTNKSDTGAVYYKQYKDWKYTLPLPPESMSISTPFAVQTTVTLGGIVEEHNAAPIRYISFHGTTGFLPYRSSGASRSGTGALSKLEDQAVSIFAGTVNTARSAYSSAQKAIGSALNNAPKAYNVHQEAEFNTDLPNYDKNLAQTTGFKQIALLRDFLESYVAKKKLNDDEAKGLRLAVAIWKESQVFLVSPASFVVSKDVSSPLEYKYSLDFKAWKRISLEAGNLDDVVVTPIRHSPNLIARAINTLTAARQAVQKIGTLKQAVLGDVDYLFKPFHDTILLGKDLLGASMSLSDIPQAVKDRVTINVLDLKNNSSQLWNQLSSGQTSDSSIKAVKYSLDNSSHYQDTSMAGRVNTTTSGQGTNRAATTTPMGGKSNKLALKDIPDDLASQIPISALSLPQDVKKDILSDISRVRTLRRKDFEDYANTIRNTADKIAFLVGAGDPTYAETYGINIAPIKETPTQSDWDSLNALNESVIVLQQFAATADGEPAEQPTFLERFGGLAVSSGIAWKQPISKFAIPFPFGATLEGLASSYLKDPNRYMEIIALNGLRSPYIDEIGYSIPILVNGKEKTVVVNQSDDLFVGKKIWLSSNAANRVQFTVESIRTLNGVSYLKMDSSVDSYRVADNAVLEAFLSGTICSRNLVWIPSDIEPLDLDSVITKDIPGINAMDPMVSIGGVDLLLGSDMDLILVNDDLRYAVGLANIIQWVKTVLSIEKGELVQHRTIGMPLSIGLSLADFNAQDVVNAIRTQLTQSSMFSRIDKVSVKQNGSAVSIDLSALVAGTTAPLPLSYSMALN